MRMAWIALGMIVGCSSWAAESPKSSGTAERSPPVEISISNQTRPDQYPTKDAPLPVTILQSPVETERAAETERRTNEYEKSYLDTQIRLVKFARTTVWVSIFGVLIAFGALIFLIRTFRETRNAADAARDQVELSHKTFIATHRPRIILREAYTTPNRDQPIIVFFQITNTGGTAATIVKSKFAIFADIETGFKRQVRYGAELTAGEIDDVIPVLHKIEAGQPYTASCSTPNAIWKNSFTTCIGKPGEESVLRNIHGPSRLFFFGMISYDDDAGGAIKGRRSGIIRQMAFYRRLDPESCRFIPLNDPQLEYSDERA